MKVLAASVAMLVLLVSMPANAGPTCEEGSPRDRAICWRTAAREHFSAKRYEEAAKAFAASYAHVISAARKYNEGLSWDRAGNLPRSADAYQKAVALGTLRAEDNLLALERLKELEKTLGLIAVPLPEKAKLRVAHAETTIPARVHVNPGKHTVTVVTTDGREQSRTVDVPAGERVVVRFPKLAAVPTPAAKPPPKIDSPSDGLTGQHIAGATFIAVGAATGIASAILGGLFLTRRGAFVDDGQDALAARDRAVVFQTATSATFWPAVGLLATGAVLLITVPSPSDEAALELGPGAVNLRIRF